MMRCRRSRRRSVASAIQRRCNVTAAGEIRVGDRCRGRQQALDHARGQGPRRRRHHLRVRRRHAQRAARPVGLRQVDDAAPDRGSRAGRPRAGADRRARRHRPAAGAAEHRDGVPELRAVPASLRRREHRVRPQGAPGRAGRHRRAPRPHREAAGTVEAARPAPRAAVGRPAAARRAGPRDHRRGAGVPDGRAAVEPRRAAAPGHARRDPRAAAGARHHDGLRDARPGRGDVDGRPRRAAQRRQHRAGRDAGRPVRGARQHLRRPLHRHAADEPAAARRGPRRRGGRGHRRPRGDAGRLRRDDAGAAARAHRARVRARRARGRRERRVPGCRFAGLVPAGNRRDRGARARQRRALPRRRGVARLGGVGAAPVRQGRRAGRRRPSVGNPQHNWRSIVRLSGGETT